MLSSTLQTFPRISRCGEVFPPTHPITSHYPTLYEGYLSSELKVLAFLQTSKLSLGCSQNTLVGHHMACTFCHQTDPALLPPHPNPVQGAWQEGQQRRPNVYEHLFGRGTVCRVWRQENRHGAHGEGQGMADMMHWLHASAGRKGGQVRCWQELGMVPCGQGTHIAAGRLQTEQLHSASALPYIHQLHFHYSSPFRGTLS